MATGQQNINIGTADNANDGDVLRAAFRKVRKMFAEIYGDTDAENLTDTETVPSTSFDTHITEKIQDVVGGMVTGNTENNITVTYDDSDGTLDFDVSADITDVNAGAGMTGTNEGGGAATLNVVGGDGITVNADEVEATVDGITIELSASDGSGALRVKDDGITPVKINILDDSLAATDGHIMVADGTDFSNVAVSGDATIDNAGVLTIGNDKITEAKLGDEFTTREAISASAVDFSSAAVFTKTISAATTLTFSNVTTGAVKTLIINGDATLTLTGVTTLNGTYSGTASKNVIQIISTNGSSEMFATISNVT